MLPTKECFGHGRQQFINLISVLQFGIIASCVCGTIQRNSYIVGGWKTHTLPNILSCLAAPRLWSLKYYYGLGVLPGLFSLSSSSTPSASVWNPMQYCCPHSHSNLKQNPGHQWKRTWSFLDELWCDHTYPGPGALMLGLSVALLSFSTVTL